MKNIENIKYIKSLIDSDLDKCKSLDDIFT